MCSNARAKCTCPSVKSFVFFRLNSAALPVKTWSQARDCFVPWSTKCRLCPHEETTEHYFIDYRDAIFFWDILQRTLKKEDDVTPISILFLPFRNPKDPSYGMFVLSGLHSLWKSRMCDRHAETPRSTE